MLKGIENVYKTPMGAVLLRLYLLETGGEENFDPLHLINWWVGKLENPDAGYAWLSTSLWRQLARHIHSVIAFNFPCLADAAGYDLGIETSLIPKPEIKTNPDGTILEYWSVDKYAQSLPPFGFKVWQRPLKSTPVYFYDLDELVDIDQNNENA